MIVQLKRNFKDVEFKTINDDWSTIDLSTLSRMDKILLITLINSYKITVGVNDCQCINLRQNVITFLIS